MEIIAWNSFKGYYVVSKCKTSFDGLKFHFHGTYEECEAYLNEQKNPN